MSRKSTSSMGALHPILFMIMVYFISVVLAFFVCNTIYKSLHNSAPLVEKGMQKVEGLTALK